VNKINKLINSKKDEKELINTLLTVGDKLFKNTSSGFIHYAKTVIETTSMKQRVKEIINATYRYNEEDEEFGILDEYEFFILCKRTNKGIKTIVLDDVSLLNRKIYNELKEKYPDYTIVSYYAEGIVYIFERG